MLAEAGGGDGVPTTEGEGVVERRREKGEVFPRNALVGEGMLNLQLPLRQLLEPVQGSPLPHFALVGWDGDATGSVLHIILCSSSLHELFCYTRQQPCCIVAALDMHFFAIT